MRYSCDDIKFYLDHTDADPKEQQAFIDHMESCPRCANLISLDPELEEKLISCAMKSTQFSCRENVLVSIEKYEGNIIKETKIEKLLIPVICFLASLPIFITIFYWNSIKTFAGSISVFEAFNDLKSLVAGITLPDIDYAEIAGVLNSEPVIMTFISVTAVIWAFSILEAQKALK
jgi:hypothetical protein